MNLSHDQFLLGQKESGEYKGCESLTLLNHTEEEKKRLTLNNYLCRKDEGQFDMINFAEDEISIVKLYKQIKKFITPPKELGVEVPDCFYVGLQVKKILVVSTYFVGLLPFCYLSNNKFIYFLTINRSIRS